LAAPINGKWQTSPSAESSPSVERFDSDVKDIAIAWLGDNKSTDLPVGLQFTKNTSYHTGIMKQSPYMGILTVGLLCPLKFWNVWHPKTI